MAADAGRPLRAAEVAVAAGLATDRSKVEGLRSKLKLLAARAGWPGARRPVHAAGSLRENRETRTERVLLPRFEGATPSDPKKEEPFVAAHCAVPPDDPFAASRAMFGELATELTRPAQPARGLRLEELLDERGRELQRQLLQDHLNLRAAGKNSAPRAPCPRDGIDGITRTRLETGHDRLLATLFGTVRVPRCAWRSPGRGTSARPMPPCRCRPGGTRTAWRSWPRSRPPAAPSGPHPRPRRCGPATGNGRPRSRHRRRRYPRVLRRPDPAAVHVSHAADPVRGLQGHRDAPRGAARRHREGRRPPGEDADPAVGRGEAEPQADGRARHRLRRRGRESPPARRDRPARRPLRNPRTPQGPPREIEVAVRIGTARPAE